MTQPILSLAAFLTTLLKNVSVDLWVGLTSDANGQFQWIKSGLLSYTNWAPGEPLDNSGPHHNKTPVYSLTTAICVFHQLVAVLMISLAASGKLRGDDSREPGEENGYVGLPGL